MLFYGWLARTIFIHKLSTLLGLGRVASRLGHLRLRQEFSGSNLGQVIVLYK